MLKKAIIPVIIFVVAIIFFKIMLSSKDKAADIEFKEHVWRVEQNVIEKKTLSPSITLYGKIESFDLFNVAAPASSQVDKILVREGQRIEKGQLMLALDQADFEPLLKQSQAKVAELHALIKAEDLRHILNQDSLLNEKKLLQLSKKALSRAEKVKKQNLGSISETEQAMQQVESRRLSFNMKQFSVKEYPARMEQLQARLLQAEADLERSRLALQRSQVYAPFTGIVAKLNVGQGDRVNSNEKLLSFYSLEQLEIRAKLPINILYEIQNNLLEDIKLTGIASTGGRQLNISLDRLSGQGQASGIDAIFAIDESLQPNLRIGSIVVLSLQRAAQKDLIKVPYQAMYGTDRLYKIVDSRLELVKAETIGEYQLQANQKIDNSVQQSQLLIRSDDLQSGDTILVTHLPNAFTGLKVETVSIDNSISKTQNK
ncbi:MAG: biotin/lipoyl-binding protein [Proteobacteria bacterium]|nr:biotin/lipoyl-binding protein [Pseudomonadota bacterium]